MTDSDNSSRRMQPPDDAPEGYSMISLCDERGEDDEIEELIDKYHRLKQEAQDETSNTYELGMAEAYGQIIQDLEEL